MSDPAEIARTLANYKTEASKVQAVNRPYFRTRNTWTPTDSRNETALLKSWATFFQIRAMESGKKKDCASAERDLKTAAKLADYVGQSNDGLGAVVQVAINQIVRRGIDDVVKRNHNSPESLRLAQSVEAVLKSPDFETVLKSETAHALISAKYLCAHPDFGRKLIGIYKEFPDLVDDSLPPNTPADPTALNTRILRRFSNLTRICQANKSDLSATRSLLNGDRGIPKPKGAVVLGEDLYAYQIANTALIDEFMLIANDQTIHRLASLGFELLAYQKRTGSLPETLDALTTKQAINDSWSNKPFLYRVEDKGIVLFSVGKNQTDDGGFVGVADPTAEVPPIPDAPMVFTAVSDDIIFQTVDRNLPCLMNGVK